MPEDTGRGWGCVSILLASARCAAGVEAGGEVEQVEADAVGGVAGEVGGVEVVAEDGGDAEGADGVEVVDQGFGVVFGVAGEQRGGDGRGVEHDVVEDLAAGVVEDGFDVLRRR